MTEITKEEFALYSSNSIERIGLLESLFGRNAFLCVEEHNDFPASFRSTPIFLISVHTYSDEDVYFNVGEYVDHQRSSNPKERLISSKYYKFDQLEDALSYAYEIQKAFTTEFYNKHI